MSIRETEVAVVGAGSVGSMAAWQLAERGVDVVAIDRFPIPGPFSAYAGESRIFRKVYLDWPQYAPILERAEKTWRELEVASGQSLLEQHGAVTIFGDDHPDLQSLLEARSVYGLDQEVLVGDEARSRFPGHVIRETDTVFFDPSGGYVRSDRAVVTALRIASSKGAKMLANRKVLAIEPHRDRWRVRTSEETVIADKVIVSAGTGAGSLTKALGTHLAVLPQVLTWFPMARANAYSAPGAPVFLHRSAAGQFYGFPSLDGWTVKVAASIYLPEVESMEVPPAWDPSHLDVVRGWVGEFLPDLIPDPVRTAVCADGYIQDRTGLLGEVPGMPGVVAAVGFSGHGFKMSSAVGAVAVDLVLDGASSTNVSFMEPGRFRPQAEYLSGLNLA